MCVLGACVDLVYIVLLYDYRNRSYTNCSSVDIPDFTRFLYNVPCAQNENVASDFEKWQILLISHLT